MADPPNHRPPTPTFSPGGWLGAFLEHATPRSIGAFFWEPTLFTSLVEMPSFALGKHVQNDQNYGKMMVRCCKMWWIFRWNSQENHFLEWPELAKEPRNQLSSCIFVFISWSGSRSLHPKPRCWKMLKDLWLCMDCTMSSQNPTISKYELLRYVMYLTISHYISLYLSNMQVLYPQQTSQQPHLWDPRTAAGVQPVGPWWTWVTHLDQLEPELNTYWCVKHVGNGWDMMGCWDYDLLILWIIFSKIPYVKRTSKNSVKMQKKCKKKRLEVHWSYISQMLCETWHPAGSDRLWDVPSTPRRLGFYPTRMVP